jgi:hypothetical protein
MGSSIIIMILKRPGSVNLFFLFCLYCLANNWSTDLAHFFQVQTDLTIGAVAPGGSPAGFLSREIGDVSDYLDLLFRFPCNCPGNGRRRNSELLGYFCHGDSIILCQLICYLQPDL